MAYYLQANVLRPHCNMTCDGLGMTDEMLSVHFLVAAECAS